MQYHIPRTGLLLAGITLLLAVLVGFDVVPQLRGDYGWRWPYIPVEGGAALLVAAIMGGYMGGVALLRTRRPVWPLLLWAMIGTVALSLAVAGAREGYAGYALFTRTASGGATGPHMAAAAQIDWQGDDWRDWPETMHRIGGHVATSPPGMPMLYGLITDVMDTFPAFTGSLHRQYLPYQCHNYLLLTYSPAEWASAWLGVLMPLWAGLGVIPLYGAARRLLRDEALARWAVTAWPLVPAVVAFAASWNTLYPALSVACFYLYLRGMDATGPRQWAWFGAAGLVLGVALFAHFVFLPLFGLLGFYTLGVWLTRRPAISFVWAVRVGVAVGAGAAIPWLVYWLAGGATVFAVLEAGFDYHLDLDRPVWFWRYWNVADWALWTGVAAFGLWIAGTLRGLRRGADNPPLLGVSLLLTVLVMALSGTTLGESGRIWLFLSPFVLLAALDGVQGLVSDGTRARVMWWWMGAQAVLAVVLVTHVFAMGTEFTAPPHPPQVDASRPVSATFTPPDGAFRLDAWDAEVDGDSVRLSLVWQGVESPMTPYWFGAFLVGPDGATTTPVIWQPGERNGQAARYPSSCWASGVTVGDRVDLPLPDGASAGEWWVSLAVFGKEDEPEGRVRVMFPDGNEDVQVGLGPIQAGG